MGSDGQWWGWPLSTALGTVDSRHRALRVQGRSQRLCLQARPVVSIISQWRRTRAWCRAGDCPSLHTGASPKCPLCPSHTGWMHACTGVCAHVHSAEAPSARSVGSRCLARLGRRLARAAEALQPGRGPGGGGRALWPPAGASSPWGASPSPRGAIAG